MKTPPDLHPDDTRARDVLAGRLRNIREASNLGQAALADRLGITFFAVSQRERRRIWRADTVQGWARGLGYRLDLHINGLAVPDDGDPLAALYAAQQPLTVVDEDQLDLRILVNDLRRIRLDQGLSQATLGGRMGCTESSVCRRESNPDGVMVNTLQRFVRALGGVLRLDVVPAWQGATV